MSLTFARSLTELFKLDADTRLTDVLLNRILAAIETRLQSVEGTRGAVDQAIAQMRQVALDRINDVLTPALENVLEITERGFLVAKSASSRTLGDGFILTFTIDDEAERALFTPSPFVALTREATPDDYGIARTVAYDRETGDLICDVVGVFGAAGPHDDWVIAALAGPTLAMIDQLAQTQAALAAAEAARDVAIAKAAEADDEAAAAAAQAAIATTKAAEAAASAAAAAVFNPANYYTKTEVDDLVAPLAPKESPAFTGTPQVPTAAPGTNNTQAASTEFVEQRVGSLSSFQEQTDIFTASGTATKPAWAKEAEVICIGGGGGGGSGRKGAAGTERTGGSGGSGGGYSLGLFRAEDVPATVPVTIGAGGAGAAAQATNSTNGNAGSAGGNTSFGTLLYAGGGGAGTGGSTTFANAATGGNGSESGGGLGGAASTGSNGGSAGQRVSGGVNGGRAAAGGSGGGNVNTSNVAQNGGQGINATRSTANLYAGGGGATPAGNSVAAGTQANGTDYSTSQWWGGQSGDGGAASTTGAASPGANGGKWGGGGGGGGASVDSVGNSGAGGNGAPGLCVVIWRG